eukprot:101104-Prymnesium_polylepis.1
MLARAHNVSTRQARVNPRRPTKVTVWRVRGAGLHDHVQPQRHTDTCTRPRSPPHRATRPGATEPAHLGSRVPPSMVPVRPLRPPQMNINDFAHDMLYTSLGACRRPSRRGTCGHGNPNCPQRRREQMELLVSSCGHRARECGSAPHAHRERTSVSVVWTL